MSSNKGITMTSLVIYVIGMTIAVGIIATLTSYFYNNINVNELEKDDLTGYTRFSNIFIKEINKKDNKVIDSKIERNDSNEVVSSYIIFSSGNQYTFINKNNSIYKNKIKICDNIDLCAFSHTYDSEKKIYYVEMEIKTGNIDKTGENALKYTIR